MKKRTHAILDRLVGLQGIRIGSRNRGAHLIETSREPRVNFNEHSNKRPTRDAHASGRGDSLHRNHSNQGKSQPSDFDRREVLEHETAMATAFKPLNKSMKTFLTRFSRINEPSGKSKRVLKKPGCYKNESDDCIDTWIEVMKLHFDEEDLKKDKNAVRSPATWKRQP